MKRRIAAAVAALVLSASPARAWWHTAHEIIAQIADNHLSPRSRSEVDRLLRVPLTYPGDRALSWRTQSLVTVSPWADTIETFTWQSEAQKKLFASLHFVNAPIDAPVAPSVAGAEQALQKGLAAAAGENVVYAIKSAIKVLTSEESDGTRALALRFLVHLAGDVHQPLHCADPIVNDRSTLGGNELPLLSILYVPSSGGPFAVEILDQQYEETNELHALWDAAGGAFRQLLDASEAGSEKDLPIVAALAVEIETSHAGRFPAEITEPSIDAWAVGSVYQAMSAFQTPDLVDGDPACSGVTCYHLSLTVQTQIALVSRDRIYIGGQRLARLLDALFDPATAEPAYVAYVDAVAADPEVSDIYAQLLAAP